ncbi:MAG: PLP-dependent aminotransferase family protein, partial [Deltaproteobacteria bacterium]|nr:PLP-dependent aminotransferase family protein [Deltaproteobacteria bacterium]
YSFSKSLFPGLRIGSLTTRGRSIDGLVALKHATDLSDSMPLQAALAEFIGDGAYERHLGRIRRMLRKRHAAVAEALTEHLPQGATWTRPEGGYQVWVELPFAVDTRDLLADASREGVLFSPGSQFQPGGGSSRCLRLTLAQADEQQIGHGLEVLGRLIRSRLESQTEAHSPAAQHL